MRLVCISDNHGLTPSLASGDVLVHAGDLLGRSNLVELQKAADWLKSLNFKTILLVPGNHDFLFEERLGLVRETLGPKVEVLIDRAFHFGGLNFYGSPWQPRFFDWAFNLEPEAARAERWARIPADTQVLITHSPPFGLLDQNQLGQSCGCRALRRRVGELKALRLHVFGHIHEAAGSLTLDGCCFHNASYCNTDYKAAQEPLVLELDS